MIVELLITLIIVAVVMWIATWVVSYLPAPQPFKNIVLVVIGLLLLIYFLQRVGVAL